MHLQREERLVGQLHESERGFENATKTITIF